MAEDGGQDKEQKTEQPTQRRIEEAMKRGQIPFSREVTSFLLLFVLLLTIAWYAPVMMHDTKVLITPLIERSWDIPVEGLASARILKHLMFESIGIVIGPLMAAVAAAFAASLLQNGVRISSEPIKPKLSKISPLAGLKRIFSVRSVIELIKGLIKIGVVAVVAYYTVIGDLGHVRQMTNDDMITVLLFLSKLAVKLMINVCIALFFIALVDLIYQRFDYIKNLRMSKQELKEEYKQQEGDPIIKQKLRQIRMERARKRMMAAVPGADVVITNPTHFAVALKYESAEMQAPRVVAKGQDNIALIIRKIAEENDVPVVENPPLARALFAAVDIDEEIPLDHYKAVAEIISYVYRLKGKLPKMPGGGMGAPPGAGPRRP